MLRNRRFTWEEIQREMIGNKFKQEIKAYNHKKTKPETMKIIRKEFTSSDDWSIAKLKSASKALGPIGDFLEVQLEFIDKNEKLEPKKKAFEEYCQNEAKLLQKINDQKRETIKLENGVEEMQCSIDETIARPVDDFAKKSKRQLDVCGNASNIL